LKWGIGPRAVNKVLVCNQFIVSHGGDLILPAVFL
jgi:hypothetical protein